MESRDIKGENETLMEFSLTQNHVFDGVSKVRDIL